MTNHSRGAGEGPPLPLVSVLICSMDSDTLAGVLASVAAQSYDAIEVVVVNACSRPHRPLSPHCGRFALRLVDSGGFELSPAAAANRAMAEAKGEWLLFLDDDEPIDPQHVARLREARAGADGRDSDNAGLRIAGLSDSAARFDESPAIDKEADLAQLRSDRSALQAELARVQAQADELARLHADSVQAQQSLQQQLTENSSCQQQLQAQMAAAHQAYARLDQGYRNVTSSLSWRVTSPLRALRGGVGQDAMRRELRAAARGLVLALPVSSATRQRVKVRLASSNWGAPLLRWLAPPAALPQNQASPAPLPTLDKDAVRAEAEATLTEFLDSGQRLQFAQLDGAPRVSVITVLFNQAGLSLLCLQALAKSRVVSFETLVVDNASSDRVPQMMQSIDGVQLLTQQDNLGFLRAVNLAAGHARGEYLLLLNNDAVVEADTLAHAVARLDADPRIGAVGGPILLWDGRLQEAGSIIWRDGSCLGYGRGDAPDAGPYRFVRDVDYCSGAFLMLRRELFECLGRFDDAFAPAYYEESDFCVRLWQSGHRVVYDPAVRVKHFEFASDAGSGQALVLQTRNRALFEAKHSDFLANQHASAAAAVPRARMRLPAHSPKVLVIDDRVPLPSLGRGYPRAAGMLHALVKAGAFVTHYPLLFPHEDWAAVYGALPETVEVMQGLGMAGLAHLLNDRAGLYDIVLVSRPHNMEVVQAILKQNTGALGQARLIYDAEALFSLRDIARDAVLGSMPSVAEQRRRVAEEMLLAHGADSIITVSELEAGHYRDAGYQRVHVLGHALRPCPSQAGFAERAGFLFVGALEADNSPNTDSVLWFVREVWPSIRAALGDGVRLDIVGPSESRSVAALADGTIKVWGRVDALEPFYNRARVFIVPTRFSAGIPHKAHEAAAHGLPLVVTTLIANQLGWSDPAFPQAADAVAFASACVSLHSDAARWAAARQFALDAVTRDCAPEAFDCTVQQVLAIHAPVDKASLPIAAV